MMNNTSTQDCTLRSTITASIHRQQDSPMTPNSMTSSPITLRRPSFLQNTGDKLSSTEALDKALAIIEGELDDMDFLLPRQ
eukprot:CAMPEP_0113631590 /NCGR_PEP_ID=MMETSP0017_2-20120614/16416_1 /TAXON_ID=2856 /ORGANISM="Cylindrotheca closterium" /LENGTH=80 /DNA_ID=CAMNT_0000542105 /DNA_START=74 /DNA_END=316 /DNA_ORIENTATION=+ /assembly_acc=CAM_ASM_000147